MNENLARHNSSKQKFIYIVDALRVQIWQETRATSESTLEKATRSSVRRRCWQTFTLTILKLDDPTNDIHRLSERCGWGGGGGGAGAGAGGDSHSVQAQIQGWTFFYYRRTLLLSLQLLCQFGVQLLQRLTALWNQSAASHTTLIISTNVIDNHRQGRQ